MIAHLVDLHQRRIYPAEISVENGRILQIRELDHAPETAGYILPGFVDAHVHIESSMLPPAEFARMAVVHGTVATVSDPHEIANVLGHEGVLYMLEDAARVPLKFCFGAPSCVPATGFETAGAVMDSGAVEKLLQHPSIGYLSEMMNFPGVLFNDAEVMAKIAAAHRLGKPVDGHAPGLRGEDARRYFAAGISTDHECFTYEEGREKAQLGVKILIREGSAARNFEALWPLLQEFPAQIMFCSDDKHPDDLVRGHINELAARAIAHGCDLFDTLRAACIHPVLHYRLPVGLLREGDPADFVKVADLRDFRVLETWIDGVQVAVEERSLLPRLQSAAPNQFVAHFKTPADFQLAADGAEIRCRIIEALDVIGSDGHQGLTVNWENVHVAGVPGAPQLEWVMEGTLADAARKLGVKPAELALDILIATDRSTPCVFFIGFEEHVRALMQRDEHTVGSDGILVGDRPHPRSWGTFPRMLETYVRKEKVLTLTECIRHMTSSAADRLHLPDRGRILEGAKADLVVFDSDTVSEKSTYAVPRQAATGIFHVMVNGKLALEDGQITGSRSGRVMRMAPREQ